MHASFGVFSLGVHKQKYFCLKTESDFIERYGNEPKTDGKLGPIFTRWLEMCRHKNPLVPSIRFFAQLFT